MTEGANDGANPEIFGTDRSPLPHGNLIVLQLTKMYVGVLRYAQKTRSSITFCTCA